MSELEIENQGIIEKMTLPDGFLWSAREAGELSNNYLEYQARGTFAMICYEQSGQKFIPEDIEIMATVLSEKFDDGQGRLLNITGDPAKGIDDGAMWDVLCLSFVFGGYLTRDGVIMDMDASKWELRGVEGEDGSRTVVIGRMKFIDALGRRSKREALVVLPQAPSESGCGYLWLEGNSSEIRRFEKSFFTSIGKATYRKLAAAIGQ